MNYDELHAFLRRKTIINCELPEEDIIELDKEVKEAREKRTEV